MMCFKTLVSVNVAKMLQGFLLVLGGYVRGMTPFNKMHFKQIPKSKSTSVVVYGRYHMPSVQPFSSTPRRSRVSPKQCVIHSATLDSVAQPTLFGTPPPVTTTGP